jgi:hypothetical protein
MDSDAREYLEAERAAWRPFQALLDLSDDDLSGPLQGAHGWSGRDLMAHLTYWQGLGLEVARELVLDETSETKARSDADWDTRGGEVLNEEVRLAALGRSMDEVRARFRLVPVELRSALALAPESRWLKNNDNWSFLLNQTTAHYAAHAADLAAVLAAATSVSPASPSLSTDPF